MTSSETQTQDNNQILIFNDIYLEKQTINDLVNISELSVDEVVQRIRQIYIQTNREIDVIVEQFKENNYNVLETIKSFYSSKIVDTTRKPTSVNQMRMNQIRSYMSEREKIKTKQQSPK